MQNRFNGTFRFYDEINELILEEALTR